MNTIELGAEYRPQYVFLRLAQWTGFVERLSSLIVDSPDRGTGGGLGHDKR